MSSTPVPYNRQAQFSSFQTPEAPGVGLSLEAEFNKIDQALDATQARLGEIQRDDGWLRNESVHPDALNLTVRALLAARNGLIRGQWAAGRTYAIGDVVGGPDGQTYIAALAHVSTDFTLQLAAGNWLLITGFSSFSAGGTSNHAQLQGLLNDDHPQYLNRARADAIYVQTSTLQQTINNIVNGIGSQVNVLVIAGTAATLDGTYRNGHILCTSASPVTLTLRANTGNPDLDWRSGDNFTVVQKGAGQVTVAPASGVNIEIPSGFFPRTRARFSPISFVCDDPGTNTWTIGNDMATS